MKVALYARVSTERQQERRTISSQLEALRSAADADGHEVIEEFTDDGYSGARLDRPALDRLRDAAEAGVLDGVICLAADRLARVYAYQVLIIEELERFGVTVRFLEGPAHGEDPQTTLLVQMQGVIAEYERDAARGISLVMPRVRICRAGVSSMRAFRVRRGSGMQGCRHNHRLARKASRLSGAR